jgi:hypothetical protein
MLRRCRSEWQKNQYILNAVSIYDPDYMGEG